MGMKDVGSAMQRMQARASSRSDLRGLLGMPGTDDKPVSTTVRDAMPLGIHIDVDAA